MVERKIHTTVSFGDPAEVAAARRTIRVELDDLYNVDDEGNPKNNFEPDGVDPAFIIIAPSDRTIPYEVIVSNGSIVQSLTGNTYQANDTVYFIDETEAILTYKPEGGVSYQWVGSQPKNIDGVPLNPIFDENIVKMSEEVVGILQCSYIFVADQWKLVSDVEGEVLVVALQEVDEDKAIGSTIVEFIPSELLEEEGVLVDYDLELRDFCNNDVISNAAVELDGVPIGTTNVNGLISLGQLQVGQTYALKVTRSGYIDSDLDDLLNDEFTITT